MYKKRPELAQRWSQLMTLIYENLGKRPKDLNAVLFDWRAGAGPLVATPFFKENKIYCIAICKVLSYSSYYLLDGVDADGWPHWVLQKTSQFDLLEQEQLLKWNVLEYFEHELGWLVPNRAKRNNSPRS